MTNEWGNYHKQMSYGWMGGAFMVYVRFPVSISLVLQFLQNEATQI